MKYLLTKIILKNNEVEDIELNIYSETSKIKHKLLNITNKFINLTNIDLKEILNLYKDINNEKLSYDDFYSYLYNYYENTNSGKYSKNFKLNNKWFNYHGRKKMFCNKCKKFIYDDKKCLLKSIKEFNALTKSKIIKALYVVPPKYINEIIILYHIYSGHKGYHNLVFIIIMRGII